MNWKIGTPYKIGDRVKYNGKIYRCLQDHESNTAWTPEETINVLWKLEA